MIHSDDRKQKYPIMGYFCVIYMVFLLTVLWSSCAPPLKVTSEIPTDRDSQDISTITAEIIVPQENIRQFPNGSIIGKIMGGESVAIIAPKGNWMYCNISDTLEGWIWAPSLSFPKFTFLNVQTFFPGPDHRLTSYLDIKKRLGSPSSVIQDSPHCRRLVYENTLQDGYFPFGTDEFRQLELTVVEPANYVVQVDIDLGKKEANMSELLNLFGFDDSPPSKSGFQDVRWNNVFPGLGQVVMERYEGSFKSFSRVHISKEHPDQWKDAISILDRSCQIGQNNQVTIYIILENTDTMVYSDVSLNASFFDDDHIIMAEVNIGPLDDVLVSQGQTELFIDRNIPDLSGRKDLNYEIDVISALPLFTVSTP